MQPSWGPDSGYTVGSMLAMFLATALASTCESSSDVISDLEAAVTYVAENVDLTVKHHTDRDPGVEVTGDVESVVVGDDTANLTVQGPSAEARFALGSYENEQTGKSHWSFLAGIKARIGRLVGQYGEDDNNVKVKGSLLSWGFMVGRQVADDDGDGMPEATTYTKIGPIGVEFTTEMIRDVVPEERYHELAKEAADAADDAYGWWPSEDKARYYRQTLSDSLEAEAARILAEQ